MQHAGGKTCACGRSVRARSTLCPVCRPPLTCQFPDCEKKAQYGCEGWCKLHRHLTYCSHPDCDRVVRKSSKMCVEHNHVCHYPGCRTSRQNSSFCRFHGGGSRCTSEACALLDVRPARFRDLDGKQICWGCFTAQYPERAKLKVRKEHLMLAELQRRLPWLGERATQLIWDCPVPGGCTLKRPDMLYRLEDRFVQVEVDEEGHEDLSCADEDSRLELIAADVGLPGLVLRLNPDAERVLKRRRWSNGEPCFCVGDADAFNALFDSAEAEVEAFLNEPAPEGVRVAGFPASWWEGR